MFPPITPIMCTGIPICILAQIDGFFHRYFLTICAICISCHANDNIPQKTRAYSYALVYYTTVTPRINRPFSQLGFCFPPPAFLPSSNSSASVLRSCTGGLCLYNASIAHIDGNMSRIYHDIACLHIVIAYRLSP